MSKKLDSYNEDLEWQKAINFAGQRKFESAVESLDKIILNSEAPAFFSYTKATFLYDSGDFNEALAELNRSIRYNNNWSQPHRLKAYILYTQFNDISNLDQALGEINVAIELSNQETSLEDFSVISVQPEALRDWLQSQISTSADMANLRTSIISDIRQINTQVEIERLKDDVYKERMRNVEILGVFAAIVALVLASAQAATKLSGIDFLWLGLGLTLPIAFMIGLISPAISDKKKFLLLIVAIAVAGGVLGYLIK